MEWLRSKNRERECKKREEKLKKKLEQEQKDSNAAHIKLEDTEEKYAKLSKEYSQLKSKSDSEWYCNQAFVTIRQITMDINEQLLQASQTINPAAPPTASGKQLASKAGNAKLLYQLRLDILTRYTNNTDYSLCLLRIEEVPAPIMQYRTEYQKHRTSVVEVAETQFCLDTDMHMLDSHWHETYVSPTLGSFDSRPFETYEQRHFFSLLTHMKMLFAARTNCVYDVTSCAPATCKLLYHYYNDQHTYHRSNYHSRYLDSDNKPLPLDEKNDVRWYRRGSGKYAASQFCWNIQRLVDEEDHVITETEKQTMKQDNKLWAEHIKGLIQAWMTRAQKEKATIFNASNQYVVQLFEA